MCDWNYTFLLTSDLLRSSFCECSESHGSPGAQQGYGCVCEEANLYDAATVFEAAKCAQVGCGCRCRLSCPCSRSCSWKQETMS